MMFVCSFKLNKTRLLSGLAAICLTMTLVFLLLPNQSDSTVSGVSAKNQQEMVSYLEKLGYSVTQEAILVEQVKIPEQFGEEYTKYNELQKSAGFDLSKYMGRDVYKYTFKVLHYDSNESEVVANLLVCENAIVGGDISSTELGGFCHGLAQEKNSDSEQKTE